MPNFERLVARLKRYRVPYVRRSESFLADRRCKSGSPLTASTRRMSYSPVQCVRLSQKTGLRNITHPATLMKATVLAPPRTVLRSHLLSSHHQTGTKAQGVPADCGGSMRGTHSYAGLAILTRKNKDRKLATWPPRGCTPRAHGSTPRPPPDPGGACTKTHLTAARPQYRPASALQRPALTRDWQAAACTPPSATSPADSTMSSMPRGMQAGRDARAQPQKLQAQPHSLAAPWAAQTDKERLSAAPCAGLPDSSGACARGARAGSALTTSAAAVGGRTGRPRAARRAPDRACYSQDSRRA